MKPKLVMLSGWGSVFDLWMSYKRGDLLESPDIRLKVPSEIKTVMAELRKPDEEWARLLLLDLLKANDQVLLWMVEAIEHFRANLKPGGIQSSYVEAGDTLWCLMGARRGSRAELETCLEARLVAEQYRTRARYGVGLGFYLLSPQQTFLVGVRRDAPCEANPQLEKLLASAPPRRFLKP